MHNRSFFIVPTYRYRHGYRAVPVPRTPLSTYHARTIHLPCTCMLAGTCRRVCAWLICPRRYRPAQLGGHLQSRIRSCSTRRSLTCPTPDPTMRLTSCPVCYRLVSSVTRDYLFPCCTAGAHKLALRLLLVPIHARRCSPTLAVPEAAASLRAFSPPPPLIPCGGDGHPRIPRILPPCGLRNPGCKRGTQRSRRRPHLHRRPGHRAHCWQQPPSLWAGPLSQSTLQLLLSAHQPRRSTCLHL